MSFPQELFTTQSMLTLGGATAGTVVVCNGLQAAFNFNPKWLALAVSLAIALVGAFGLSDSSGHYVSTGFIAVLNGFLIYCTALGANTVVVSRGTAAPSSAVRARGADEAALPSPSVDKRRFTSPWI
jgi:hypothetical protein